MKKKQKSFLLLLLVLGAFGFLGLSVLWQEPEPRKKVRISASSPEAEQLVNKHLWMASQKLERSQEQIKVQNAFLSPQIGDSIWPKGNEKAKQTGVDHSPDRNESNAFDDLNRYRKDLQVGNPDHVIQEQLSEQDLIQEYTEAYRAEYARQFVENAKKNGYLVRLNKDYVVIGVTELPGAKNRDPSGFNVGSGSQAK